MEAHVLRNVCHNRLFKKLSTKPGTKKEKPVDGYPQVLLLF